MSTNYCLEKRKKMGSSLRLTHKQIRLKIGFTIEDIYIDEILLIIEMGLKQISSHKMT
jgi:hypothetical protein